MIRLRSKFEHLKEGLAACLTKDETTDYWNNNFADINTLQPHEQELLIPLRDRFEKGTR